MARPKNTRTSESHKWPFGMRVGCMRDAERCVDGRLVETGRGAFRIVYMNADRTVVYKRARDKFSNLTEWERMVRIARAVKALSTPCTIWTVDGELVLAMVARPTAGNRAPGGTERKFRALVAQYTRLTDEHLADLHGDNWRLTPKGRPTLTDAGDVRF